MTNCEKCGAPLHNGKCDYCGADYRDILGPTLRVDTYAHQVDTLAYRVEVPLDYMCSETMVALEAKLRSDMAYKMSLDMLKYMDIETWIDPVRLTQVFGGRIRVARPD